MDTAVGARRFFLWRFLFAWWRRLGMAWVETGFYFAFIASPKELPRAHAGWDLSYPLFCGRSVVHLVFFVVLEASPPWLATHGYVLLQLCGHRSLISVNVNADTLKRDGRFFCAWSHISYFYAVGRYACQ